MVKEENIMLRLILRRRRRPAALTALAMALVATSGSTAEGRAGRRLNRNALIRARGGFGADPLLPVELMKPALPE